MFDTYTDPILRSYPQLPPPHRSGQSRAGRPLPAYRFGRGPLRISLIAGCHADEPTGPRLLRQLVNYLHRQPADHPLLRECSWWIVPHANPDGEAVNLQWYSYEDETYDIARYLRYAERTLPKDDVEFGFPITGRIGAKRPENQFIQDFWLGAGGPFHLHASLHSMGIAFGAWFLIDAVWMRRTEPLQAKCLAEVNRLDYPLHDVDRKGEKGFHRIAPGFATRPNFMAMRRFFLEQSDKEQAQHFHPSSMDSIRSLGGDCLTLVSELPLFLIPREEPDLSWPNPLYNRWKDQLAGWKAGLMLERETETAVRKRAREEGLQPMAVTDQMRLQWEMVVGGLEILNFTGLPAK